jgi:carbonic anhydrase
VVQPPAPRRPQRLVQHLGVQGMVKPIAPAARAIRPDRQSGIREKAPVRRQPVTDPLNIVDRTLGASRHCGHGKLLVMGHTSCGAIKGAIDNAQLGNLTGLLAKIRPAVQATQYQGERSAKNYDFVDTVARKNVELTITDIHRRSAVLADLESSGAIKIVGAMYIIETGLLEFLG